MIDRARTLDAADPLSEYRERFDVPEGVIYLDGNSLGCLPKATPARLEKVVREEWGNDLIRSWNTAGWIDMPKKIGAKIAPLIGAEPHEVIACDSTSVNLFKLISAALAMRPGRKVVLSEPGNFPTDLYMIEGLERQGLATRRLAERDKLSDALGDDVALLMLTHAHYKTGELFDMAELTRAAHDAGALVLWDLSHSGGALPVDLNGSNADFAVGCGYKYLNGGPGAPAFIFVAERHQDRVMPVLSGWLGHARPFDFSDIYEPAPGIDRFRCSSPSILAMASLECGLDIFADTQMTHIRTKSVALCDLLIEQVEARLAGHGFTLASPRDATIRGSQVSFTHEHGYPIVQALIDRGVIGDYRDPGIMRFGFTPLYVSHEDVWQAVEILQDIMTTQAWDKPHFHARAAVT